MLNAEMTAIIMISIEKINTIGIFIYSNNNMSHHIE